MGAKRKLLMEKDGAVLCFDSFSDARRYFGRKDGSFPSRCLKRGWWEGWRLTAGETPYHGMYGTKLYRSWSCMKTRCTNPNIPDWENYGGRGIRLCEEWHEFIPFMEWAKSHGYEDGLTIERIDVNGDYCPENCCWIPKEEQVNNRRTSVIVNVDGRDKTITSLAREHNIPVETVRHRLKFGWSVKDALTRERRTWPEGKRITCKGKTLSLRGWEKETGIYAGTIAKRLERGWTTEDALTVRPDARNRRQTGKIKRKNG